MGGSANLDGDVGLQIAPMVDVVFVLLLFFMASANLQQKEQELGVSLPRIPKNGAAQDTTVSLPINLDIDENGVVFWNNLPLQNKEEDMSELRSRLNEIMSRYGPGQTVVITPSPMTQHGVIAKVLSTCTAAGVKNLCFGG
ncbi:MAG: biopolymer transporter ExbD [Verrucomicrobiota bacterium]|nr:biopolymer transporter ExbD [Verrucomicrobiota bacterium]